MEVSNTEHTGGGLENVVAGLEHFPKHLYQWITGSDSGLAHLIAAPLEELVAYEKIHGKEQVSAIVKVGLAAYSAALASGLHKSPAVEAGVKAAFESGLAEVKSLSTLAMQFLLSAAAAKLAV